MEPNPPVLSYHHPETPRLGRVRTIGEELTKLAGLGWVFVIYGLYAPFEKGATYFFIAGVLLWVGVPVTLVLRRLVRGLKPATLMTRRWIRALTILFFSNLAMVPVVSFRGTSPHGWRWANNQFGIAYSTVGGPCNVSRSPNGRRCWNVVGNWDVFIPPRW